MSRNLQQLIEDREKEVSALKKQLSEKDEEIRLLMSDMAQLYQEYVQLSQVIVSCTTTISSSYKLRHTIYKSVLAER